MSFITRVDDFVNAAPFVVWQGGRMSINSVLLVWLVCFAP